MHKNLARISVKGKDAKKFLHRISTNDVLSLANGESCINTFLNEKGRMIEVVHHLQISESEILLSNIFNSATFVAWLDKFLFVEDVVLEELSPQQFDNEPHEETLRIENGVPIAPNEINENYNPLEVNLEHTIHWDKGCYIGQEVILRLKSYNKVNRTLVGITASPDAFSKMAVGQEVSFEQQILGDITSVSPLYVAGGINALAILKAPREKMGPVYICNSESHRLTVVSDAFKGKRPFGGR